jgi:V/A-type H+-transporting ATPase subunit G/H
MLMQEIVTKVLAAEREAETKIQQARSEAGKIRAEADRKAQEGLQAAREQATGRSEETLAEARSQAQAKYEKALQQSRDESRAFFESRGKEIELAVQRVTSLIIAPEWEQERRE